MRNYVAAFDNSVSQPRGGGGVALHTTCYAPASKKSVEKGMFLDIRRRRRFS